MEPTRRTRTRGEGKPDAIVAETTLTVMSKFAGASESKPVALAVRKFEVEPAYVRLSAGVTKNLGNFESLRLDVAISMPCYTEEIDKVIPKVGDMVASHLESEIQAWAEAGYKE